MNRKFKIKIFDRRIGFTPNQTITRFFLRKKMFGTGFTLTELLIVVIILGILATLALPMLVKTIEKAKIGEAISNLNLIRTGQKIYFLEYSAFTSNLDRLNIEDPNDATSSYFDYSIPSADSSDFTGRAQRKSNAPGPYDTYYYDIQKGGTITSNGPLI
ncbi:MAG: type II secretion system GspH family protein [Candidatus Omnitrophica bacterium]|nr:type II secretion system GspH family protein [Candidatus Omnitrophota bacterium]MBU1932706.1 type II secretion system GspH family protein [Candidatus Omnitrophota bacterium]